jgi:2,4-dienoyl-CoA reductase-like NADH-dependent reductase (Old Yellow Enzyme family)
MPQPLLFTPLTIRGTTLKNRIVVAPMHQYAAVHGHMTDWHLMNYGRFAAGGAGLVFIESTKVERRGCGTVGDVGLWADEFIPGMKRIADFIRAQGSVPALQLGHSGRKARAFRPWEGGKPLTREAAEAQGITDWEAWELVAPSAIPAGDTEPTPRALDRAEIPQVIQHWVDASRRADEAGIEILELHGAHGFLLHEFLSPIANRRTDEYGGSEANRMRLVVEVVEAVRTVWPEEKPLFLRLSAQDDAGWGLEQSAALARIVGPKGVDVIDCSGGGMTGARPNSAPLGYGYQVPSSEFVRREGHIKTMAVGLIVHADQAEAILQEGRADLAALAREILYNPNWPLDAARKLGAEIGFDAIPPAGGWWLGKRAQAARDVVPSTYGAGLPA